MTNKQLKILIAEDDIHVRFILQKFLEPLARVHSVADGEETLAAIKIASDAGEDYDLICLDIMMPKKDGITVLKEVRDHEAEKGVLSGRGVKIIMITALTDPKSVMKSFSELCDGYLFKPVRKEKLIQKLKDLGLLVA